MGNGADATNKDGGGEACLLYQQGDFTRVGHAIAVSGYDPAAGQYETESEATEGLVVVSQTCDVARSAEIRPYVTLAPLVFIDDENEAGRAAAGHRPQYAFVPGAAHNAFADLDRVAHWRREVVAGWAWERGLQTEEQKRWFADAAARKFARYAYPDEFYDSVKWLVDRVKSKHGKTNSPEGAALAQVQSIRVVADWEDEEIEATLMFVLKPDALPNVELDAVEVDEQVASWIESKSGQPAAIAERLQKATVDAERFSLWTALAEAWALNCEPKAPVTAIIGFVRVSTDFTLDEFWGSHELDLDYLSGPDDD